MLSAAVALEDWTSRHWPGALYTSPPEVDSLTLEPYRTFPPPRGPYRCCRSVTRTQTYGEQMLWRGMLPSLRDAQAHGSGFPPFRSQDQRRGRPIMVIIPRPYLFGNGVGGFEKALRICNKIIYHTVPGLRHLLIPTCQPCEFLFYVLYTVSH